MTNEETLNLLKPIMLDGTEKVGDKVYCVLRGFGQIESLQHTNQYPLLFKCSKDLTSYTKSGFEIDSHEFPSQNNNQERVIQVLSNVGWIPRVLHIVKNGEAICWDTNTLEHVSLTTTTTTYLEWRELPAKITKEEALRRCDEIGIDAKDMLLNALSESGADTTNLIIE